MLSEEQVMENQKAMLDDVVIYNEIPYSIIGDDIEQALKDDYYQEMNQIISLYNAYRRGMKFITEGSNANYVPSDLRYKKAASIINKEARFLFANPPTFNLNIDDVSEETKVQNTILQDFLDKVLEKNQFNTQLSKAVKDCFVGKRVAIMLNFNEQAGITVTFLNSLEFIYEASNSELRKIVSFYNMVKTSYRENQRWFKKTYELDEDGSVYVTETIYDGLGKVIKEVLKRTRTRFSYIPAVVILNDGLIGENDGESELVDLLGYEQQYSKLANADMDAMRKSMNPTRYTIDASESSTASLSTAPGSYWDLQSDEEHAVDKQAQVGMLEPTMAYSSALKVTLDRIENTMYGTVDVPNINSEQLQGVITSGKTLKALYWGLSVRCDEKMLTWGPALSFIAATIIDGGRLYSKSIKQYTAATALPTNAFTVTVENNYPLPEDENEEKNMDLAEITAQTMSRKAYLKKWRKLSDEEAEKELLQIKAEQDLFDNSSMPPVDRADEQDVADVFDEGTGDVNG